MLLLTKSSLLFGKKFAIVACLAGQSWLGTSPTPVLCCWLAVNVYAYALMHMQPLSMEHLRYADGKRIVSIGTVNLAKIYSLGVLID